jgi:perosamine synthetase
MEIISYGRHHIDEDDIQAVVDCLRGRALTQGSNVFQFEEAVASYVGSQYAVAVSSGTAALHLASLASGASTNSSIITSPITFVASSNVAFYVGARPVFSDVNSETVNLSAEGLSKTLREYQDVKVVIPVHFAGLPCDMVAIDKVCKEEDIVVIEDAAQALGARYPDGSKVGCCSKSLMTVFSFHPVKSITTGEGGVITTNDEETYRKLLRLRNHGIVRDGAHYTNLDYAQTKEIPNPWYYEIQELGFNYRITDIQCALGSSQLLKLERFVEYRQYLTSRYDKAFLDLNWINPVQQRFRKNSAHHLYPVRIDFDGIGIDRARLMTELQQKGIATQVHHIPVPMHPYYQRKGFSMEDCPNAQEYYDKALSLPLYYDLTEQQQDRVIDALTDLK